MARLSMLASLILVVASVGAHAGADCTDDAMCSEWCRSMLSGSGIEGSGCDGIVCNSVYKRCDCPIGAILLRNGRCLASNAAAENQSTPEAQVCDATHDVLLTAAIWASPELSRSSPGDITGPFATILRRSVAAAVGSDQKSIGIFNVEELHVKGLESFKPNVSGIFAFDWRFSFCAVDVNGNLRNGRVDPYDFEHRLSFEAQNFEAFAYSTIRVLTLESRETHGDATESTQPGKQVTGPQKNETTPGGEDATGFSNYIWVFAIMGVIATFVGCTLIVSTLLQKRQLRLQTSAVEPNQAGGNLILGPGSSILTWFSQPGADATAECDNVCVSRRGMVTRSYDITCADALGDKHASDAECGQALLSVREGDVVIVLASNNDWLYGCRQQFPEVWGFFPTACVSFHAVANRSCGSSCQDESQHSKSELRSAGSVCDSPAPLDASTSASTSPGMSGLEDIRISDFDSDCSMEILTDIPGIPGSSYAATVSSPPGRVVDSGDQHKFVRFSPDVSMRSF